MDTLQFSTQESRVWLAEQRTVLISLSALAYFRRDIVNALGNERAKSFFMRLGFFLGLSDADLARSLEPDAKKTFLLGPQLHSLRGMVKVEPKVLEYQAGQAHFYAEFDWLDSFEVEIVNIAFDEFKQPACWILLGYACAYSSHFTGLDIQYREVSCRGQGDQHCRIVGKLAHEWPDHAEFAQYYRQAPLIEELYQLHARMAELTQETIATVDATDALGEEAPFTSAVQMLDRGAQADLSLLLIGETGTGKEVLARRVHRLSPRHAQPFVAVNCAAIPPELIEAELFGVEKGAFTGAQQTRIGRFERAHGGTLFLDEIIELSPRAQAAMLRVLQEGELERVGGQRTHKVNVRIIAATNEDLDEAVKNGRFRADLFYRINAFTVRVPPLRERQNDIPLLAEHFRVRYEKKYSKATLGFTEQALAALYAHDWPGNIRELENTVERSLILTDAGQLISDESLFHAGFVSASASSSGRHTVVPSTVAAKILQPVVENVLERGVEWASLEQVLLEQALDKAQGNVSEAARMLGLSRPAFAYRLRRNQEIDEG